MARVNRKSGGTTRGRFKRKRMGKGYSTFRKVPIGTRPVLKITEPEEAEEPAQQAAQKPAQKKG